MHFLSDAIAEIEGLLEVNRDFCKKQVAEKASPALPTNCAVVPLMLQRVSPLRRREGGFPLAPLHPFGLHTHVSWILSEVLWLVSLSFSQPTQ
jgi:hypothetical protein